VTYDYVYRWHGPHYGRRCAIVALSKVMNDHNRRPIHNTGSESVAIEFEDGTRVAAERQQLLLLGSKQARQVLARVEHGGLRIGVWRARQKRRAA
jgi:hypothetical protein